MPFAVRVSSASIRRARGLTSGSSPPSSVQLSTRRRRLGSHHDSGVAGVERPAALLPPRGLGPVAGPDVLGLGVVELLVGQLAPVVQVREGGQLGRLARAVAGERLSWAVTRVAG